MLKNLLAGGASLLAFATLASPAFGQASAAPTAAARISVPPLAFTTRTLPNGLRVYALRDTRTASVTTQMWYDVGSKDDPAGRSGFAHLFEHILSRVTRNIPPGGLSRLVEEEAGGTRNASTGPDTTNYYETVPANQLEAMLWAHAERMGRSVLDQSVFDAERNIVKEEMRQRVLSQPYGRLQRYYLFDNVFESHPYRRSGIGTMADLDAATLDEARAFHANFYRPDNAILIVSGNFDPAQLDRLIDRHLGTLARPNRPILRSNIRETGRRTAETIDAFGPNVPLPAIGFAWQRPNAAHRDTAAFTVLNRILTGGQSSRMFRTLVYERQLAQSVQTIDFPLEQSGLFGIMAIAASGKPITEVEPAVAAEIARLRDAPVSEAELAEARNEIVSEALFRRESPENRADEVGTGITRANDPRWSDRILADVQRVTAADVQRVARTYLSDATRLTLRYSDQSQRTGPAAPDPSATPTDPALGRSYPPSTATPNTLAPEGERMAPPAPGPVRPITPPTFAERRLANGMRVVVARSTDLPLASAFLIFGGGASADPAQRPGTASMMTTLVDNGAAGMTAPEIAARIESLGARIGASASGDGSYASVSAPLATFEAAGRLLSDIVRRPDFAQAELERERRRALDQLRVNMRNPTFVSQMAYRRAVYGDAPYGAPVGGTPTSLAALSRDDLTAYHAAWWRPDNATLIIGGGLDAEAGFALAERLFGDWEAPATPMPALPANRAGTAGTPRVVVVDMPDADQSSVAVVTRGIPRGDSAFYPLLLADSALGGSSTSRLFQEVRVRRALSYGAYSNLLTWRDEGLLVAGASTRNDAAPQVAQVMLDELRRLAREPFTADQLQKRQNALAGSFGRDVETTPGLTSMLATLAIQGLPMSEFNAYLPGVQGVTPQAISAAVAAEIDPAQATIVIAGRAREFIDALRQTYPNVEVIPLAEVDFGSPTLRGATAPAAGGN